MYSRKTLPVWVGVILLSGMFLMGQYSLWGWPWFDPLPPADRDGDGIADVEDNCVHDFNPDQEDSDADGAGDVCDPCPDDPDDLCVPADSDGDDIADVEDNCADDPNPDQEDTDADGAGDVCDPCPDDPDDLCDEAFTP